MTTADKPSIFYKESCKGFRQLDHELDGKGNAAATGALGSSGRLILRNPFQCIGTWARRTSLCGVHAQRPEC